MSICDTVVTDCSKPIDVYLYDIKDPVITDYNLIQNKPAIDGLELTNETTSGQVSNNTGLASKQDVQTALSEYQPDLRNYYNKQEVDLKDAQIQAGVADNTGAIQGLNYQIENIDTKNLEQDDAIGAVTSTVEGLGSMSRESADDYTPTTYLSLVAITNDYNDLTNKPNYVEKFRGAFNTIDDVPAPSDPSWEPPVTAGDYVDTINDGSPERYIADLVDDEWASPTRIGASTPEEVATLYESNSDVNRFTNDLKTKLDEMAVATANDITEILGS